MKRRTLFGFIAIGAVAPKAEAQPTKAPVPLIPKAEPAIPLPVGMIMPWSPNGNAAPPDHWLLCDGRAVTRLHYRELFSVIGTTYGGGDGSTTFNLPNFTVKTEYLIPEGHNFIGMGNLHRLDSIFHDGRGDGSIPAVWNGEGWVPRSDYPVKATFVQQYIIKAFP